MRFFFFCFYFAYFFVFVLQIMWKVQFYRDTDETNDTTESALRTDVKTSKHKVEWKSTKLLAMKNKNKNQNEKKQQQANWNYTRTTKEKCCYDFIYDLPAKYSWLILARLRPF